MVRLLTRHYLDYVSSCKNIFAWPTNFLSVQPFKNSSLEIARGNHVDVLPCPHILLNLFPMLSPPVFSSYSAQFTLFASLVLGEKKPKQLPPP